MMNQLQTSNDFHSKHLLMSSIQHGHFTVVSKHEFDN